MPEIAAEMKYASDWLVGDDDQLWSKPEGSTCYLSLAGPDASERVKTGFTCYISIIDHSNNAGRTFGLVVAIDGLTIEDQIVFPGNKYELKLLFPPGTRLPQEINFRAYDPNSPSKRERVVTGRHSSPSLNLPSISVVHVRVEPGFYGSRYKQAIIAAGHAASQSIFPPEAQADAWWNTAQLAELLNSAITTRTPFSMVRLGDGEGRLLAYPWLLTEQQTARDTIGYMFGRKALDGLSQTFGTHGLSHAILTLQRLTAQALSNADCLGIPAPVHFERFSHLPIGPERDARTDGMLGMAGALIGGAKYFSHLPPERMFDTYIFKGLHLHGRFMRFLRGLEFIGIISHTNFSSEIGEYFQIRKVTHLKIPGHQSFMPSVEVHFPDHYEELIEKIAVPFTGALFLVAAGYLGKTYCDVIKQRGGIAIDIGSVFDGWCGIGRHETAHDLRLSLKGHLPTE